MRAVKVLGHWEKCAPLSLEAVSRQLVLCVLIIVNEEAGIST